MTAGPDSEPWVSMTWEFVEQGMLARGADPAEVTAAITLLRGTGLSAGEAMWSIAQTA